MAEEAQKAAAADKNDGAVDVPYVEKLALAVRTGLKAKITPHANESHYEKLYNQSIKEPKVFWDKVRALYIRSRILQLRT